MSKPETFTALGRTFNGKPITAGETLDMQHTYSPLLTPREIYEEQIRVAVEILNRRLLEGDPLPLSAYVDTTDQHVALSNELAKRMHQRPSDLYTVDELGAIFKAVEGLQAKEKANE